MGNMFTGRSGRWRHVCEHMGASGVSQRCVSAAQVCSAAVFGEERVCDEWLRAAQLNIDKVGWKTARARCAVELERASAFSSVANYSCNYNHMSATVACTKRNPTVITGESQLQNVILEFLALLVFIIGVFIAIIDDALALFFIKCHCMSHVVMTNG